MRACTGWLLAAASSLLGATDASAQSNDGFHSIQVIPVAVDSTSFTQRFILRPWALAETPIAVCGSSTQPCAAIRRIVAIARPRSVRAEEKP